MTAVFYLFLFEYLFHNILKSTIRTILKSVESMSRNWHPRIQNLARDTSLLIC